MKQQDPRFIRAKQITNIKKILDGVYSVQSQTDSNVLYIVNTQEGPCTCPDNEKGNQCKHYLAAMMKQYPPNKLFKSCYICRKETDKLCSDCKKPVCMSCNDSGDGRNITCPTCSLGF